MKKYIVEAKRDGYMIWALLTYLCLVIFSPYIKIGGRDNFEITFIVNLCFAILIPFAARKIRFKSNGTLNVILCIMLAVLLLDTVSILNYIRVTGGIENILSNVIPNVKVMLYVLLILWFYFVELDEYGYEYFIRRILPAVAAISGVIGIFQRFNFLNFNSWFTKYYISSESGRVLIEVLRDNIQWSRVLGTLSNPNFYSLQLVVFIIIMASNLVFRESYMDKAIDTLIIVLLFTSLIFTQSRTALLAVFGICFYIALIQIIRGGRRNALKYIAICIGVVLLSLLLIKLLNLNYLFDAIRNGLKTRSITQRVDRWREAVNLFKLHPVVGIGPVIGKYFSSVDNEYVHILRNYGVVGLMGHLCLYLYVFVQTFKDILRSRSAVVRQYAFASNCSILAVMITNMTMATFYHWRNFILVLIITCMWAKVRSENQ